MCLSMPSDARGQRGVLGEGPLKLSEAAVSFQNPPECWLAAVLFGVFDAFGRGYLTLMQLVVAKFQACNWRGEKRRSHASHRRDIWTNMGKKAECPSANKRDVPLHILRPDHC